MQSKLARNAGQPALGGRTNGGRLPSTAAFQGSNTGQHPTQRMPQATCCRVFGFGAAGAHSAGAEHKIARHASCLFCSRPLPQLAQRRGGAPGERIRLIRAGQELRPADELAAQDVVHAIACPLQPAGDAPGPSAAARASASSPSSPGGVVGKALDLVSKTATAASGTAQAPLVFCTPLTHTPLLVPPAARGHRPMQGHGGALRGAAPDAVAARRRLR